MAKLLVSVRSAEEAQDAMDGGASIIDVKEPSLGSLGRASSTTIARVVARVAGHVPVSAALGELSDHLGDSSEDTNFQELNYVKWGLGLAGSDARWQPNLLKNVRELAAFNPACLPVAVAYADWPLAQAPTPDAILTFVQDYKWPVFLLDTWKKNGRTLLDWLSLEEIRRFCERCRQDGIQVALAGSLGIDQISALLALEPDIFAVRGAACRRNDRSGTIDPCQVQLLVDLLNSSHADLESSPRTLPESIRRPVTRFV
jgi:uncharacterized protein (UPF0264 family)